MMVMSMKMTRRGDLANLLRGDKKKARRERTRQRQLRQGGMVGGFS